MAPGTFSVSWAQAEKQESSYYLWIRLLDVCCYYSITSIYGTLHGVERETLPQGAYMRRRIAEQCPWQVAGGPGRNKCGIGECQTPDAAQQILRRLNKSRLKLTLPFTSPRGTSEGWTMTAFGFRSPLLLSQQHWQWTFGTSIVCLSCSSPSQDNPLVAHGRKCCGAFKIWLGVMPF